VLPDTRIDDVKKQRNAEYAKHINDPVLSSLKMEGIRLFFFMIMHVLAKFKNIFILRSSSLFTYFRPIYIYICIYIYMRPIRP
jgi:hypothetical protein